MIFPEARVVGLRLGGFAVFAICCAISACSGPAKYQAPIVVGDAPTSDELRASGLQKDIQILSFPNGGILELNNEYIGTTPMTLTVRTGSSGTWTSYGSRVGKFVLKCSSPDGLIWEEKVWLVGQRVPDKILFRVGGDAPITIR